MYTRIRKAYWTAFVVVLSYLKAALWRRLLGQQWYERHIMQLHERNALRVKHTILELQGLFIKIGQMLSVMSNFLPDAFQRPLESLQNKLPSQPYSTVRQRMIEELGNAPEVLFAHFDQTPMATASIGQAHRATLPDGTAVVVKVQHYGIESVARTDLAIIKRLTSILSWFMDIKGLDYVYDQVRQMIEEELDFGIEAQSMQRIAQNLREDKEVQVPEVFAQYSSRRVLTTRYCTGVKISDIDQLEAWSIDRHGLAARLMRVWCHMVFKDAFYHADPHPGNILVDQHGHLTLLDFGATGRLSPEIREGITQLIEATVKSDTEGMLDACRTMGFLADGPEAEQMARKMIAALRNFLQKEIKIEGLNFRDIQINPFNNSLADLVRDIGFKGISSAVQVPKDYVLLERTVALLLGIINTLAPTYNPLETIRPYAQNYLLQEKGGPLGYVRELLQNTITSVIALPGDVQKTLLKARAGELEFRTPGALKGAERIAKAIRYLTLTVLAVSTAFFGLRLRELGFEPESRYCLWAAGGLVLWVLWRGR